MIKMASTAAEMIVTRSERKVEDDDDDGCMHGWMDVGREGGREGWMVDDNGLINSKMPRPNGPM